MIAPLLIETLERTALILAILTVSTIFIGFLFWHSRKATPGIVRRLLLDAVTKQKLQELLQEIRPLEAALYQKRITLERLERSPIPNEMVEQRTDQMEQLKQDLQEMEEEIATHTQQFQNEANSFATSVVDDINPSSLNLSTEGNNLHLEFVTVVVIVASVLILGILGVFNGDQLSPILASIAGYVLGRSSHRSS